MKAMWIGLLVVGTISGWRLGASERRVNVYDTPQTAGVWVDSREGKFIAICCAEDNGEQPALLLMDKGQPHASLAFSLDKSNRPYMQVRDPETGQLYAVDLVKLAKAMQ